MHVPFGMILYMHGCDATADGGAAACVVGSTEAGAVSLHGHREGMRGNAPSHEPGGDMGLPALIAWNPEAPFRFVFLPCEQDK